MQQKRKRLSKREIAIILSLDRKINALYDKLADSPKDVALHYGNGSVATQLSCASAALESILQEF